MNDLTEVTLPPITIPGRCFVIIGGTRYENHSLDPVTLRFERTAAAPPATPNVVRFAPARSG